MIRELCRHCWRTPLCKSAMCPHKVIATTHQPHPTLQRELFVRSGAGLAHQRGQTGAEGSLQALDVSGVDQRSYRTLGTDHARDHLCLGARNDTPEDFHHPPTPVALYDSGDHDSCGQHQPRTANLAAMKRFPEDLQRLRCVACQPSVTSKIFSTGPQRRTRISSPRINFPSRCRLITEPSYSLLLTSIAEANQ